MWQNPCFRYWVVQCAVNTLAKTRYSVSWEKLYLGEHCFCDSPFTRSRVSAFGHVPSNWLNSWVRGGGIAPCWQGLVTRVHSLRPAQVIRLCGMKDITSPKQQHLSTSQFPTLKPWRPLFYFSYTRGLEFRSSVGTFP